MSEAAAKPATGYAYRITGVDGCMVGRVKVGDTLIERRYMGRAHDWNVFNTKTCEDVGGFTGTFLCKVQFADDKKLTAESRRLLQAKRGQA